MPGHLIIQNKTAWIVQYLLAFLMLIAVVYTRMHSLTLLVWLLIAGSFFTLAYIASYTTLLSMYIVTVVSMLFSVEMQIPNTAAILRLPSEPLLIIMAIAFFLKQLRVYSFSSNEFNKADNIFILLFILVMCITCYTSSMLSVSIKASLVKILYLFNFYFVVKYFVALDKTIITKWFNLISVLSVPLIIYYLWKHSSYDFSKGAAGDIVKPLFNDHTIYSCFLAFLAPYNFLKTLFTPITEKPFTKLFHGFLFLLIMIAITASGCRAAWLSMIAVLIAGIIFKFKINYKWIIASVVAVSIYVAFNFDNYVAESKRNRHDSSAANADITTQAQSVTNISSDNSNLERLNRWSCAWRMFLDKPLTGFGPGTYQFQYLDYQLKEEITPISVTSPYNIRQGHGGTAHQEYLLVLSEMGIFGFLFFIWLIILTWKRACNMLTSKINTEEKIIIAAMFFAMLTYVVHAFFNNFLDTDKTAFLFLGSMAFINQIYASKKIVL